MDVLQPEYFIGALSGTSIDGIDVALVRFSPQAELAGSCYCPYSTELRSELLDLCTPGNNEIDRMGRADVAVAREFARAVKTLLAQTGHVSGRITAIGSHGQTIRHRPGFEPAFTLQIGDPNVIAAVTGIPVVADFRRKDLALGGQGAPLVPAFHDAMFRRTGTDRVVVNIGGIANLTVLPGDSAAAVTGFDTGPGNTLMDAWSRRVLQAPLDQDGALAARGNVLPALLVNLLADPYFSQASPKSTGPEYFSMAWLQRHLAQFGAVSDADVQATLLSLTAETITRCVRQLFPTGRPDVYVCGGGAHNPVLMRELQTRLPGCQVDYTDVLGVAADWVEAMAFAWLAQRRWHGLPGNCPAVTGALRSAVLGGIYLPG